MAEGSGLVLPLEIVEEILCRLPAKSLNRFRGVSSSWQSLISDSRFVRKHLTGAAAAQADGLFEKALFDHEVLHSLPLSSLHDTGRKKYLFGRVASTYSRLVGCCDGLLCVSVEHTRRIYIWNPSTKLYRRIPDLRGDYTSVGFGYDSIGDDYKVMKLSSEWPRGGAIRSEIYSLKTGSWTKVDDFPRKYFPYSPSVYASGAIHWLNVGPHGALALSSFDLSKNKYVEVALPAECPPLGSDDKKRPRLSVLRGMLCVVIDGKEGLVLWMNEDYRDGEKSWTKILILPFKVVLFECSCLSHFKPLYMYENGEVLIGAIHGGCWGETKLMFCKDSRILFRQRTRHVLLDGFVHVESLVSPYHPYRISKRKTKMRIRRKII